MLDRALVDDEKHKKGHKRMKAAEPGVLNLVVSVGFIYGLLYVQDFPVHAANTS